MKSDTASQYVLSALLRSVMSSIKQAMLKDSRNKPHAADLQVCHTRGSLSLQRQCCRGDITGQGFVHTSHEVVPHTAHAHDSLHVSRQHVASCCL